MKKLLIIVAALSIFALASFAYGEMGGQGMGPGMMGCCSMDKQMMGTMHFKGLNLDDQQKIAMGEIRLRMMKESVRRMADMRLIQIELRELLGRDPVDMKAIEAKVKQLEMMRTDMRLSHIKAMEECKAKLTPEQRKKLRDMMEAGPMMGGMGMMPN
jgi:Spy/CpxP family protein refolding chaperone